MKPTLEQAAAYQQAFDHFNAALFDGQLPFAYLNFSRHAGAMGFFSPKRWGKATDNGGAAILHEISLNPDLLLRPPIEYYSTLVHEMCHHWQYCLGSPSRNGYHNMEWARKMVEIGLTPTSTGKPGGKPTGQRMTHLIELDGRFTSAFAKLPKEALLPWVSGDVLEEKEPTPKQRRATNFKYICTGCSTRIWAKTPGLQAFCGNCGEYFRHGD